MKQLSFLIMPILLLTSACGDSPDAGRGADAAESAALQARVDALKTRLGKIRDANEIKRLQRSFGYYMEEALWDEVAALFAEDATIEWARDGVYRGRNRIREFLYALNSGEQGLREGQLNEYL